MPTISLFYGITILMYYEDGNRHNMPHIHARYAGFRASISLEDGSVLAGTIPSRQFKLVQAWVEIHKDELYQDWIRSLAGEALFKIAPLR